MNEIMRQLSNIFLYASPLAGLFIYVIRYLQTRDVRKAMKLGLLVFLAVASSALMLSLIADSGEFRKSIFGNPVALVFVVLLVALCAWIVGKARLEHAGPISMRSLALCAIATFFTVLATSVAIAMPALFLAIPILLIFVRMMNIEGLGGAAIGLIYFVLGPAVFALLSLPISYKIGVVVSRKFIPPVPPQDDAGGFSESKFESIRERTRHIT